MESSSSSASLSSSSSENNINKPSFNKIPKKATGGTRGSLRDFDEHDEEKQVIENDLLTSISDKRVKNFPYELTDMKEIINSTVSGRYNDFFKSLYKTKGGRKVKKNVYKRKLFFIVENEQELADLVENGFKCRAESKEKCDNFLGKSESGVHLVKHIDTLLYYQFQKRIKSFFVVMAEVILTDVTLKKTEIEIKEMADPLSGYNCVAPFKKIEEIPANNHELRYFHSMIYVYDYENDDSGDLLERPRSLCPLALLRYECKNPHRFDRPISVAGNNKKTNKISNQNRAKDAKKDQLAQKANQKTIESSLKNININDKLTNPSLQQQQQPKPNQPQPLQPPPPPLKTFTIEKPKDTPATSNQSIANKVPDPRLATQRPSGCVLNRNFVPPPPRPPKTETKKEASDSADEEEEEEEESDEFDDDDDDEEEIDPFQYLIDEYSDVLDQLYVKPSRWRRLYEMTGRVDFKFKGARSLAVNLDDCRKSKLKFVDKEKSVLNVKDTTNNLILIYQSKRIKKSSVVNHSTTAQATSSSSTNQAQSGAKPIPKPVPKATPPAVAKTPVATTAATAKPKVNAESADKLSARDKLKKFLAEIPSKSSATKPVPSDASKAKAAPATTVNIKKEKLDVDESAPKKSTPSGKSASKNEDPTDAGLSSEMTSLEKRLLSMDKTKSALARNGAAATATSTSASSKTANPKSSIEAKRDELRKLLEDPKLNKTAKMPIKSEPQPAKQIRVIDPPVKAEPEIPQGAKRKRNFWEPDSDSEYDKIKKLKSKNKNDDKPEEQQSASLEASKDTKAEDEEDDGDEDIVIVSKLNLNLPPIQYSKPYYDSNISGFDIELRKLTSSSSCCSSPSLASNVVTTVTKSPIKSSSQPIVEVSKEEQKQSRRMNFVRGNRQRYIHHVITTFTNTNMTNSISQFDVDALKKLRLNSTKAKKQDPNSESEITCHEIFAGGFSCIQEHRFQKTLSYMRRAQSFNASILPSSFETAKRLTIGDNLELNSESSISNDSFVKQHALSSSQSCLNLFQSSKTLLDHNPDSTPSNKRISLNDYVCLRAKSNSHLTASTANTPNSLTCVPKPDEHQTNDMNNNNSEAKLKDVAQEPLPSLSLIDELKKRINEDNLNKENHSNDETYKSVFKDDENGFYSGSSKERKAKKRHRSAAKDKKHRKKGRKKSKKKSNSSSSSPSSDSSASSRSSLDSSLDDSDSLALSRSPSFSLSSNSISSGSSSDSSQSSSSCSKKNKKSKKRAKRTKAKTKFDIKQENESNKEEGELFDDDDLTSNIDKLEKKLNRTITNEDNDESEPTNKQKFVKHTSSTSLHADSANRNDLSTKDDDYLSEMTDIDKFAKELSDINQGELNIEEQSSCARPYDDSFQSNAHKEKYKNFYNDYDLNDMAINTFSAGTNHKEPFIEPKDEFKNDIVSPSTDLAKFNANNQYQHRFNNNNNNRNSFNKNKNNHFNNSNNNRPVSPIDSNRMNPNVYNKQTSYNNNNPNQRFSSPITPYSANPMNNSFSNKQPATPNNQRPNNPYQAPKYHNQKYATPSSFNDPYSASPGLNRSGMYGPPNNTNSPMMPPNMPSSAVAAAAAAAFSNFTGMDSNSLITPFNAIAKNFENAISQMGISQGPIVGSSSQGSYGNNMNMGQAGYANDGYYNNSGNDFNSGYNNNNNKMGYNNMGYNKNQQNTSNLNNQQQMYSNSGGNPRYNSSFSQQRNSYQPHMQNNNAQQRNLNNRHQRNSFNNSGYNNSNSNNRYQNDQEDGEILD